LLRSSARGSSDWAYSEAKDPMTDNILFQVESIQRNENGVIAEVKGICDSADGIITFFATITDEDGKPTISIVRELDYLVAVRYRLNDDVKTVVLSTSDFNNRFKLIEILGPAALEKVHVLAEERVAFNNIWGVLVEFKTDRGNLIVSMPVFHPEIRKLFNSCFG
jgi:hypothetical protein